MKTEQSRAYDFEKEKFRKGFDDSCDDAFCLHEYITKLERKIEKLSIENTLLKESLEEKNKHTKIVEDSLSANSHALEMLYERYKKKKGENKNV